MEFCDEWNANASGINAEGGKCFGINLPVLSAADVMRSRPRLGIPRDAPENGPGNVRTSSLVLLDEAQHMHFVNRIYLSFDALLLNVVL